MDPAIVGRSYREGVEAVADLLDLNPILFPRSLLAEFLRVGQDKFLKIDEVGQLAAWNIGLTGYRRPTAITEKQMEHACTNQRMRSDPQIYSVVSSFEPEPELASDPIPLSEKMVVRSEHLVEGVAGCTVRARLYGDVLFLLADTTSDEAGQAPAQNDGEGDILTSKVSILASPVDPDSYTPAYFLFGPRTKVRTLKGGPAAATQTTASPEATPAVPQVTLWNHNGSTMRLEANAGTLSMTYEIPREAMLQVGVRKGDNLFTCSRDGSKLSCTTRIFHPRCGKHDFAAVGIMSDDEKNIRIRGNAPGLDSECNESGRRPQDWAFTYLSPAE